MKFLNEGFDHVEFAVNSIATHEAMWTRFGFEKIADQNVPSKGRTSRSDGSRLRSHPVNRIRSIE